MASTATKTEAKFAAFGKASSFTRDLLRIKTLEMSLNDIKIPRSTLAELRGVLVRALSRENLSVTDKMAIRKSQSSSALKIHYTWNSNYSGKKSSRERRFYLVSTHVNEQCLFTCWVGLAEFLLISLWLKLIFIYTSSTLNLKFFSWSFVHEKTIWRDRKKWKRLKCWSHELIYICVFFRVICLYLAGNKDTANMQQQACRPGSATKGEHCVFVESRRDNFQSSLAARVIIRTSFKNRMYFF